MLAVVVALYNCHVFWTMSLYRDGAHLRCDAADDDYFMMHIFEYLKLVSYCVVPFVLVIVLNFCIIVRLRQASPSQCSESFCVATTSVTPSPARRSCRYFFASSSTQPERSVPQNVEDERTMADVSAEEDIVRCPSRQEAMPVEVVASGPQQSRQRRLTRMLLFVSFAWLALSAPFALHSLAVNFVSDDRNLLAKIVCFLLVYVNHAVNHAVNFYLYCVTGSRFRQELRAMFGCLAAEKSPGTTRPVRTRTSSKRGTAAALRQNAEDLELEKLTN